ncbi:hypothetical protein BV898_04962 [Hypsibius exemplaris]|uniref:Uncharacterized protein n=1 Tax=Hypsibius exemplaris TaxID=2072580 RepID=A0A1W0X182_HYPEX|nr:hypothetical protein BV898_04962 [Hypsibius exemplaris]
MRNTILLTFSLITWLVVQGSPFPLGRLVQWSCFACKSSTVDPDCTGVNVVPVTCSDPQFGDPRRQWVWRPVAHVCQWRFMTNLTTLIEVRRGCGEYRDLWDADYGADANVPGRKCLEESAQGMDKKDVDVKNRPFVTSITTCRCTGDWCNSPRGIFANFSDQSNHRPPINTEASQVDNKITKQPEIPASFFPQPPGSSANHTNIRLETHHILRLAAPRSKQTNRSHPASRRDALDRGSSKPRELSAKLERPFAHSSRTRMSSSECEGRALNLRSNHSEETDIAEGQSTSSTNTAANFVPDGPRNSHKVDADIFSGRQTSTSPSGYIGKLDDSLREESIQSIFAESASLPVVDWNYGHVHPVIPAQSPSVSVHRRPSTLSGVFKCQPTALSFAPQKKAVSDPVELLKVKNFFAELTSGADLTAAPTAMDSLAAQPLVMDVQARHQQDEAFYLSAPIIPVSHLDIEPVDRAISNEIPSSEVNSAVLSSSDVSLIPPVPSPDNLQLQRDHARFEFQLQQLQSIVESITREKSELQFKLSHLEAHNRVITASLQSVSTAREDAVKELSGLKSSARSAEQKLHLVTRDLQYKSNEFTNQKTRLESLQKTVDQLRKSHSEEEVMREEKDSIIKALKGKVSDQQMELEQIRQEKSRLQAEKNSPSKSSALSVERDYLSEQLAAAKKDQQQLSEDLRRMVDQRLEDRLQQDALRRDNAALSQKIVDLQHSALKEKTQFLKQLEKVETEQRQKEGDLLRRNIVEREANGTATNGVKVMSELEWKRFTALVSRTDVLEVELTSSKTENQSLRERLLHVENDRKDLSRRVIVAEKSLEERDATIEFLNRRLQASGQRVTELSEKVSVLGESAFQLKTSLVDLDRLQADYKVVSNDNVSLKSSLNDLRKRSAVTEQQRESAVTEIKQLKSAGNAATEKIAELNRNLTEAKEGLTSATSHQTLLQRSLDSATHELSTCQSALQSTRQELALVTQQEAIWRGHAAAWQSYSEEMAVKAPVVQAETQTDDDGTEGRIALIKSGEKLLYETTLRDATAAHDAAVHALEIASREQAIAYEDVCRGLQSELESSSVENEHLLTEVQRLQTQLDGSVRDSAVALEQRLSEVHSSHSQALLDREQLFITKEEEITAALQNLEREKTELLEQINHLQGELHRTTTQLAQAKSISNATEETEALKNTVAALTSERDSLVLEHSRAAEEMTQSVMQHDAEWRRLMEEVQSQANNLAVENAELSIRLSNTTLPVELPASVCQNCTALAGENASILQKFSDLSAELEHRRSEWESEKQRTDSELSRISELYRQSAEAKPASSESDSDLNLLRTELSHVRQQLEDALSQRDALSADYSAVTDSLAQNQAEWKTFVEQQSALHDAETVAFIAKIDSLTSEKHDAEEKAAQAQSQTDTLIAALQEEIGEQTVRHHESVKRYGVLEREFAALTESLAVNQSEWKEFVDSQSANFGTEKAALQSQIAMLTETLQGAAVETPLIAKAELDSIVGQLQAELEAVKQQFADAVVKRDTISAEYSAMTESLAHNQAEWKSFVEQQTFNFEAEKEAFASEIERLKEVSSVAAIEKADAEVQVSEMTPTDESKALSDFAELQAVLAVVNEKLLETVAQRDAISADHSTMAMSLAQNQTEWKRFMDEQTAAFETEKVVLSAQLELLTETLERNKAVAADEQTAVVSSTADLQTRCDSLAAVRVEQEAKIGELTALIAQQDAEWKAYCAGCSEAFEVQLMELTKNLEIQMAEKLVFVEELRTQLEDRDTRLAELSEKLTNAERELAGKSESLASLAKQMEAYAAEVAVKQDTQWREYSENLTAAADEERVRLVGKVSELRHLATDKSVSLFGDDDRLSLSSEDNAGMSETSEGRESTDGRFVEFLNAKNYELKSEVGRYARQVSQLEGDIVALTRHSTEGTAKTDKDAETVIHRELLLDHDDQTRISSALPPVTATNNFFTQQFGSDSSAFDELFPSTNVPLDIAEIAPMKGSIFQLDSSRRASTTSEHRPTITSQENSSTQTDNNEHQPPSTVTVAELETIQNDFAQKFVALQTQWEHYASLQAASFEEEKTNLLQQLSTLSAEIAVVSEAKRLLEEVTATAIHATPAWVSETGKPVGRSTSTQDGWAGFSETEHLGQQGPSNSYLTGDALADSHQAEISRLQQHIQDLQDASHQSCPLCDTLSIQLKDNERNIQLLRDQLETWDSARQASVATLAPNDNGYDFAFPDLVADSQVGSAAEQNWEEAVGLYGQTTDTAQEISDLKEDRMRLQVELLGLHEECDALRDKLAALEAGSLRSPDQLLAQSPTGGDLCLPIFDATDANENTGNSSSGGAAEQLDKSTDARSHLPGNDLGDQLTGNLFASVTGPQQSEPQQPVSNTSELESSLQQPVNNTSELESSLQQWVPYALELQAQLIQQQTLNGQLQSELNSTVLSNQSAGLGLAAQLEDLQNRVLLSDERIQTLEAERSVVLAELELLKANASQHVQADRTGREECTQTITSPPSEMIETDRQRNLTVGFISQLEDLQTRLVQSEERIQTLEVERSDVVAQLELFKSKASQHTEADRMELQESTQMIVSLQLQLAATTSELDALRQRHFELTEQSRNSTDDEKKLLELTLAWEKEKGMVQTLEQARLQLQQQVSALEKHVSEQERRLLIFNMDMTAKDLLIQQLNEERDRLVSDLQKESEFSGLQLEQVARELETARNEAAGLLDRVSVLEAEKIDQVGKIASAKKKYDGLKEKFTASQTLVKTQRQEVDNLTAALETAREELHKTELALESSMACAELMGNEIRTLRSEVERRQASHDSFRERVSHETTILDGEIQGLREHLQTREAEYRTLEESMVDLKHEKEELRVKLKSVRRQVRNGSAPGTAHSPRTGSESDGRSGISAQLSLNGDAVSQSSVNGISKKLLLGITAGGDIRPPATSLKFCMESLKSEIDDLKSQMDLHIQVVKSKSDRSTL